MIIFFFSAPKKIIIVFPFCSPRERGGKNPFKKWRFLSVVKTNGLANEDCFSKRAGEVFYKLSFRALSELLILHQGNSEGKGGVVFPMYLVRR